MKHSADQMPSGAAGERGISEILTWLAVDFSVLDDIDVPGSKASGHHLVIGPTGVFLVGAATGSGPLTAAGNTLWSGAFSIERKCSTLVSAAELLALAVGRMVIPVMCLIDTELPQPVQVCGDVIVCAGRAILEVVTTPPPTLDSVAVAGTVQIARRFIRTTPASTFAVTAPPTASATAFPATAVATSLDTVMQPAMTIRQRLDVRPGARRRAFTRLAVRPALLRGLVVVALVAGSLAAMPFVSTMFRHSITNSARRAMSTAKTAKTAKTANASSAGATTISSMPLSMAQALLNPTATTSPEQFAPPAITFACPKAGGGWSATPIATQFRTDPDGFNMWYQDMSAGWVSWGVFKSGLSGPAPLGGLAPGQTLHTKINRGQNLDPALATDGAEFTTPMTPC